MSNPSVDESILAYVLTLLSAVPGATAYRTREEAFAVEEGIGIVLKPREAPVEMRTATTDTVLINFMFVITLIARGTVPDSLADPVRVAIHKAIMADKTLGGRTALLMPHSTEWEFEEADKTATVIEMRFVARYHTNLSDISAVV